MNSTRSSGLANHRLSQSEEEMNGLKTKRSETEVLVVASSVLWLRGEQAARAIFPR